MDKMTQKLSSARQASMMSAAEVLLACMVTAIAYLTLFGIDEKFWNVMILALIVPWIICFPANLYGTTQRQRLMEVADKLKASHHRLQQDNKDLQRRANIDGHTGLINREHFLALFNERCKQSANNVLLIVDADHFKSINDSYGHPVGDKALTLISSVLKKVMRKNDLVGRIGGEEFGVLLPDTCEAEGEVIAEMVRHEIAGIMFEPRAGVYHRLTVSIGIAGVPPSKERALSMRNADSALFEAKRRGRNRCVLYSPGMREKPRPFYEANHMQNTFALRA
ncbi:GGDEF domain-containing protein [Parasphingorhabdus sp. JC815]|uniref:GGDEF domain-containing protein n=1 Tax=Parasphingorhabdus sp. JC815 TaxID=3232140 RepID=UPI00345AF544